MPFGLDQGGGPLDRRHTEGLQLVDERVEPGVVSHGFGRSATGSSSEVTLAENERQARP